MNRNWLKYKSVLIFLRVNEIFALILIFIFFTIKKKKYVQGKTESHKIVDSALKRTTNI